jgi:RNA 3'-terminal phosphate cyclase (ATP)
MITIDGSAGEGGGQVLRSSLALSILTGKALRIVKIRANRRRGGLLRQHLTGLRAAVAISGAEVEGAALKSTEITFRPGPIQAGEYSFAIGSAGSANLVLQTILPPLMLAEGTSFLTLEGGTHNDKSPPFHYLRDAFLPQLAKLGPKVELQLDRWGFYPAGGGEISAEIEPSSEIGVLKLEERGKLLGIEAMAVVSGLPGKIARRELRKLGETIDCSGEIVEVENPRGPGNVLMVTVRHENVAEVFTGFGAKGVTAERVAGRVAAEVSDYLESEVPVGEHLADQLLIPMALAGKGSFVTGEPSLHTTTNISVIQQFLDVRFEVERVSRRAWRISIP